jgi:hypothetical protein
MNQPARQDLTGEPAKSLEPSAGDGIERERSRPSTGRPWTPIRVVLLVIGAVAAAIVLGLYSFLTVWLALSGSG